MKITRKVSILELCDLELVFSQFFIRLWQHIYIFSYHFFQVLQSGKSIPVHVNTFNCNDKETLVFLKKFAQEAGGRWDGYINRK